MKRLSALLLALLLLTGLLLPARAAAARVFDDAGLLTDEEIADLDRLAQESGTDAVGLYIVTVEDYTDYDSDLEQAAEAIYEEKNLGLGSDHTGQMLLLSMADRDFILLAHGDDAHDAFTDWRKEDIADAFLDNFRENDWYGGFRSYLNECAWYLQDNSGTDTVPDDGDDGTVSYRQMTLTDPLAWVVSLVVGFGLALLIAALFRAQLKSVRAKAQAEDYTGEVRFRTRTDRFTHITTSRRKIVEEHDNNNHGGGGGGGTSVNSGGYSSHSGKF